jgi:hypothetical protein
VVESFSGFSPGAVPKMRPRRSSLFATRASRSAVSRPFERMYRGVRVADQDDHVGELARHGDDRVRVELHLPGRRRRRIRVAVVGLYEIAGVHLVGGRRTVEGQILSDRRGELIAIDVRLVYERDFQRSATAVEKAAVAGTRGRRDERQRRVDRGGLIAVGSDRSPDEAGVCSDGGEIAPRSGRDEERERRGRSVGAAVFEGLRCLNRGRAERGAENDRDLQIVAEVTDGRVEILHLVAEHHRQRPRISPVGERR